MARAYNLTFVQTTAAVIGANSNGKTKISFKAKATVGGREVVRTVLAQGAAADEIANDVGDAGNELQLRVLFDRAPGENDARGGEFFSVVGKPLPPKAKAV